MHWHFKKLHYVDLLAKVPSVVYSDDAVFEKQHSLTLKPQIPCDLYLIWHLSLYTGLYIKHFMTFKGPFLHTDLHVLKCTLILNLWAYKWILSKSKISVVKMKGHCYESYGEIAMNWTFV